MDRTAYMREYQRKRRAADPAKARLESRKAYKALKVRERKDPALKAQRQEKQAKWCETHRQERAMLARKAYNKIRSTPEGLEKQRAQARAAKARYLGNPKNRLQVLAHWRASRALRDGRIVRGPCEVGQDCAGRLEMHHGDYAKPLDIRWLCKRHHEMAAHRQP